MKPNKIFGTILVIVLALSSVFGLGITTDQDTALQTYKTSELGNVIYFYSFGSEDSVSGSYNNNTYFFDTLIHIDNSVQPFFITFDIDNSLQNKTIQFLFKTSLNNEFIDYWINFTPLNLGNYKIYIEPSSSNELIDIYINHDSSLIKFNVQETKPTGLNNFILSLTTPIITLININISIWKLFYYILVTSIIIGSVFGIILVLIKLYNFTKEHNPKQIFKGIRE